MSKSSCSGWSECQYLLILWKIQELCRAHSSLGIVPCLTTWNLTQDKDRSVFRQVNLFADFWALFLHRFSLSNTPPHKIHQPYCLKIPSLLLGAARLVGFGSFSVFQFRNCLQPESKVFSGLILFFPCLLDHKPANIWKQWFHLMCSTL
jgi:hypothetical protein